MLAPAVDKTDRERERLNWEVKPWNRARVETEITRRFNKMTSQQDTEGRRRRSTTAHGAERDHAPDESAPAVRLPLSLDRAADKDMAESLDELGPNPLDSDILDSEIPQPCKSPSALPEIRIEPLSACPSAEGRLVRPYRGYTESDERVGGGPGHGGKEVGRVTVGDMTGARWGVGIDEAADS